METRDDSDKDLAQTRRSAATRRAFLAVAASVLGAVGANAIQEPADAKRRGRKNDTRNKNQSNATSTSTGGAGGGGGNAGSITVVCGPGFENCQEVGEPL